MPKPKIPKIKDIAVVGLITTEGVPIGEAPRIGEEFVGPMTPNERKQMEDRLFDQISILMEEANTTHVANCKLPGLEEVDPDYITRLSTHEFFFYTQEPLTLVEFEILQNKIFDKAASLPSGVQLVLGSFAVKNADNQVMNLTPHITCGQSPSLHIIIKNHSSAIDVRYKIPSVAGSVDTLQVFDASTPCTSNPEIMVNGTPHALEFNNVFLCKTLGGDLFLTAVDICLDHIRGVAKSNVEAYVKNTSADNSLAVSHMIISNWTAPDLLNCVGTVMHVDPVCSMKHSKENVNQVANLLTNLDRFGYVPFTKYELETTPCETLQESFDQNPERLFEKLEMLKFGSNDKQLDRFIKKIKTEFRKAETLEAGQKLKSELRETVKNLESDPGTIYLHAEINNYRSASNSTKKEKADDIESAMARISIQDRCKFTQLAGENAPETKEVMQALASHRGNIMTKKGTIYVDEHGDIAIQQAAVGFKRFKKALAEMIATAKPKKDLEENKIKEKEQDETKKHGI